MKLSIVIPVYNSQDSLSELYSRIDATMQSIGQDYEVIFVDDKSKDNSWKKLVEIKKKAGDNVVAVKLSKNYGQHNAIVCGFSFCRGDYIVTMDDDLQHPPEEIPKLIKRQQETDAELVYGLYKQKKHNKVRSAGSFLVRRSSKYFGDNETGDGSSFRLFSADLAAKIKQHPQMFTYLDEVIQWFTSDIEGVEVEHAERKHGKSSYNVFKLTSLYFKVLINYTAWPLRLMTYGGMVMALITFVIGVLFIIKRFYYNVDVEGFTALIVAILFSTSLIMICFGIIGTYLSKIYHNQNGKPPYSVKKVL